MPPDRAHAGVTAAIVLVPFGGLAAARHHSPASKTADLSPAETAPQSRTAHRDRLPGSACPATEA